MTSGDTWYLTRSALLRLAQSDEFDWMTTLQPIRHALRLESCCGKQQRRLEAIDRAINDVVALPAFRQELQQLKAIRGLQTILIAVFDRQAPIVV